MVRAVRSGMSIRQAASEFDFSKSTVADWVLRSQGHRLDRFDFANRRPGYPWNRMNAGVEQRIAQLRVGLRASVLGEYGAKAIRAALGSQMERPPSEAAINRALSRRGLQDGVRRFRRTAPPKGW